MAGHHPRPQRISREKVQIPPSGGMQSIYEVKPATEMCYPEGPEERFFQECSRDERLEPLIWARHTEWLEKRQPPGQAEGCLQSPREESSLAGELGGMRWESKSKAYCGSPRKSTWGAAEPWRPYRATEGLQHCRSHV